ncbi:MAG: insulinase family protein [Acidobacteriota bacterium]|nr:insulinase family protein [Acidobacteriota bacterium]MDH3528106.1 insulinase family protein [Acidobacteriota bacterium]
MRNLSVSSIILALLVFVVLFPNRGYAQVEFRPDEFQISHKKFVLKNGLTLLVHEDKSVPIVAVNMWYHVGSRDEKRGRTGFAHLFEHFFFNGSENHPFGFREAMDDLGANNRNGTTNADRTNFFEDVPVSALEKTLFLEADRMGFLAGYISQEMLDREKGVVQNEKRRGENQPYGRVFNEITEAVYPYSHPYSWPTIGTMEDLSAATLDDIKTWYQTYYGPSNAVISLAGDISPEKALDLVTKYFGDIPPGPALPRMREWTPEFDGNMRDEMEDLVPQTRVYRVYHAPSWRDPQIQSLNLFADILAGSKSSVLARALVYEKKLVTNVSAGLFERELSSLFLITATVRDGVDPLAVEAEIDRLIADTIESGISKTDLQKFQSRNLAQFLRGSERLGGFGGRSDILAASQTYGGNPLAYLDRLETMAKATPESVSAAASDWLTKFHYTMTVKPAPKLSNEKTSVDRKVVPGIGAAPDVKFPAVQRATLSNGLGILLLERHSIPIVNMALAVDAGTASDTAEKAGLASLTMGLLDEGTKTRNAFEIANQLDSYGASLSTGNSRDLSLVRLQATKTNLAPSLEIFADVVLNPSFPADQFAIQKQRAIAGIGQEKAQPSGMAIRVATGILYGKDHAYGKPGSGFVESVDSISRSDLASWHASWFKPGSSTLIVTGDTTMAEVKSLLEKAFGKWNSGTSPKKSLSTVASTKGRRIFLIDKPDAPQSTIFAAHVTKPSGQPEDLASEPLFRNFGGMSTSRLNRNLRLEKHWSYGASGSLIESRGQQTFYVLAPVQTDKTKETMIEVVKEIKGVAGERPVEGEEFESIMRNMTLRLPGRFETLSSLEGAALEMVNYNLPDDYWAHYAKNVRSLTEADLAKAGKVFVRPDELIWIIVGDLKKIEAGVRELDYGEIIKLDQDGNPVK